MVRVRRPFRAKDDSGEYNIEHRDVYERAFDDPGFWLPTNRQCLHRGAATKHYCARSSLDELVRGIARPFTPHEGSVPVESSSVPDEDDEQLTVSKDGHLAEKDAHSDGSPEDEEPVPPVVSACRVAKLLAKHAAQGWRRR